jgi:hypothetical protein
VIDPVVTAVEQADAAKWGRALQTLDKVFPPSDISKYGIYGHDRPVTAVEWYTGHPALPRDVPPAVGVKSVDVLLKVSVEALAPYRLVCTCSKVMGVLGGELGYPHRLPNETERSAFAEFWETLFCGRDTPETYGFLIRTTVQAAVALPKDVRRLAQIESDVGLFRRLASDLATGEWTDLAHDLGRLAPFVDLAANEGLAIYLSAG